MDNNFLIYKKSLSLTLFSMYIIVFLVIAGCFNSPSNHKKNTTNYALLMGNTIIKKYPDIWTMEERTSPRWSYTYGLVSLAMLDLYNATGNKLYFNYAKAYADSLIDDQGNIKTYDKTEYNIDQINSGRLLFTFYKKTGNNKYKMALDTLRDQLRLHPRTQIGGFWHKQRYPHQMWLDGLYMGAPFYAQYAVEYQEPECYNEIVSWILNMEKVARDSVTGLLYHGWDESRQQAWANKTTGRSPNFWGRGMGWYAMALVDVADYLPIEHAGRAEVIAVINRLANAIINYQDSKTGCWYQVLDQPARSGNYLEGSATAMFSYFLLKAIDKGYIDHQKYYQHAVKAFEGMVDNLVVVAADSTLTISPVCAVAGLGGNPYRDGSYEYYINEARRDNDPKATGPFIMAALYYNKLKNSD